PSLKIRGTEWRMLRASLDVSPSHLALRNADVRAADNVGRLTFDASVGLDKWTYTALSPFQIDLNAARLSVAQLVNLADSKTPITGTLSARVSLRGSWENPVGQGTVTLNQATLADETIPSVTLNFQGDGDAIRGHLNTFMAGGKLEGDVTYFPKRKAYDGQLQATHLNLDQLRTFRTRGIHATGTLGLFAQGAGTL